MPLGHVAEAGPVVELVAVHAEEGDGARHPLVEAEHALHQGRLARPVRPDDRHDLAAADRQVDVGQDGTVAVAERRAAQVDDGVGVVRLEGHQRAALMSSPARRAAPRGCCA